MILLTLLLSLAGTDECGPGLRYSAGDKDLFEYELAVIDGKCVLDGEWFQFTKIGHILLVSGHFKNDMADGVWSWWSEDGKLKMTGSFTNNLQDDEWVYYSDGKPFQDGHFCGGKVCGSWFMYLYPQLVISNWKDDKLNGTFTVYYRKWDLKQQGQMKDGNRIGHWVEWNEDGTIKRKWNE